jgi:hypothetical protein
MEDTLLVLYCVVDDFWKNYEGNWEKTLLETGLKKRLRKGQLSLCFTT